MAIIPTALAYDFSYTYQGKTLFFNILSSNTVEVTSENHDFPYYTTYPTGDLVIPATVTYNDVTYNVTSIGNNAFYYCSHLTSVTIPNGVTSIGPNAFEDCTGLTSVTIPNGVTSICIHAFECCTGLTSVTIPNSVTSIGYYAFQNCTGLTSVTIPNSVTSIDYDAFQNCTSLTSVTIPNSVTTIGYDAFLNVRHIEYYGSATGSPWGAYSMNGVIDGDFVYYDESRTKLIAYLGTAMEVTIPNGVTSIGNRAFYRCSSLTSVTIPDGVTRIGYDAFQNCTGLTSVTIPNSVTTIGSSAFYGCSSLTSVTIGSGVTSIGYDAFEYCSNLTSVTIPNSVTMIGSSAFYGCSSLTSVTIGSGVTSIGPNAFGYCSGLTSITTYAELPPTLDDNAFDRVPYNINVYVPCGKQPLYLARWTHFSNFIEMCNSGIDDVNALSANVYSVQGRIVVESSDGGPLGEVRVCDMMGRSLATGGVSAEGTNRYSFDVPATGTYCVKIGDFPARKVVVIR